MQKLEQMGLLGVMTAAPTAKIAPRPTLTPAMGIPARTLTLAQAESQTTAPSAQSGLFLLSSQRVPGCGRQDGRQWITQAEASRYLPPGNYAWRNPDGKVVRLDVGILQCHRGKRNVLYGEDLSKGNGRADREIRSFSGGWNSATSLMAVLRRLAAMTPEEFETADPALVRAVREKLQGVR